MSTTIKQPHERELLGHPVGLFILFFYCESRGTFLILWDTWNLVYCVAIHQQLQLTRRIGWTNKDTIWLYGFGILCWFM